MKPKKFLSMLLIMAVVMSMAACGSGGSGTSGSGNGLSGETDGAGTAGENATDASMPDKRLVIADAGVTVRLDPMYVADQYGFFYANMIYDCLVESDHQGNYEPSLAESWEVSEDGKSWTFKLREGVKFQNGQDFTSADVVCSFQRVLDHQDCNMYIDHWNDLESVKAVDDYTVEITTV